MYEITLLPPHLPKIKGGGGFLSTGEALGKSGDSLLSGQYSWGGDWTGAPTCAHEECPIPEWRTCQVPKPGAHDGFLAEGAIGPRLPLLLVPTSWDTATLEPTHAQHSPHLIALKAAHLQLPLAGSWGLSIP